MLVSKDLTRLIRVSPTEYFPSLTLLTHLTRIDTQLFLNHTNIQTVTFNDELEEIGSEAFKNSSLAVIIWSSNVVSIEGNAFENTNITSLILPDSVVSIGESVASNNSDLEVVVVGPLITKLPFFAFYNCPSLVSLTFASPILEMDMYAFSSPITNVIFFGFKEVLLLNPALDSIKAHAATVITCTDGPIN
jgi:hypothetical protein